MQCSTDQRLQELQALGYGSESDYQAHSTLMQASANLAKKQIADSIAAGSTAFPHQGASNATALPAPTARVGGHSAYEVTEEDVENVLRSNALAVANTNGKSFESMANELLGHLDLDLVEQAALYGDDLDEQTDYANDEIARQLRVMGVLEPQKTGH